MKNLIMIGKEFLEDADQTDKKHFKKIVKSSVDRKKKTTKEEMIFGITPEFFMDRNKKLFKDQKRYDRESKLFMRQVSKLSYQRANSLRSMKSLNERSELSGQTNEVQQDEDTMKKIQDYVNAQERRSCSDRIVISLENPVYQVWKVIVVVMCLTSSLSNAYVAAFGVPERGSVSSWILRAIEMGFAIDLVVQFLLEYVPEDQ